MYSGQGGMPLERNAMQTVLDGWIERCQRSNQSDKESAADCRLVFKRVGHGDETYADVSSAKRFVSHKGAADTMSLTYIENSSGLRMAPCRTPALISIDDEEKPSIMVIWRRSDKKLLIQANAEPRIPAASTLTKRPSCQTRSNAFFRSKKRAPT